MIQIIIRIARITHVPHPFSMKQKRKEEKIWIRIIVLATQNSMNKKRVSQLIIRNTNQFEYYIIQRLFNDENVPCCHTENLSYEIIFIPFKYTLLLFSRFYFFRHKYKGHDFLRAGAFAPVAPPSTTCLRSIIIMPKLSILTRGLGNFAAVYYTMVSLLGQSF